MKATSILWIAAMVFIVSFTAYSAAAFDYFTYRMNFEPGSSEQHVQEMTFSGNLTITLPSGFSFVSSTAGYSTSGSNYTWQSGTETTINYTISSPGNCNESDIYRSEIYNNGTLVDEFVYVCVYDDTIVDYKVEYGHGCGNYIDELYISDETATLFNLVRVWNIGHYLDPDEDAQNANITCFYEDYPVRTYGRVDVGYEPTRINGTFFWDRIYGGYWFRIGVLSQDVSGKSVSDTYDVSCTELTYSFEHQMVVASFPNYSIEVRSNTPLLRNSTISGTKEVITLTNIEEYTLHEMFINFIVEGYVETNYVAELGPGENVTFYADVGTNVTASYIPSWQVNCFSEVYYTQTLTNVSNITINQCPVSSGIPSQAWPQNTSNNNAFDLDNYFSDPENDSMTYSYYGNNNITVSIDGSNVVSFNQSASFTGIDYVVFTADDGSCITDSNNVTLVVYSTNTTITVVNQTVVVVSGGGGGGGGGTRIEYVYIPINVTEEECTEMWVCDEWSECREDNTKARSCEDLNACGTTMYQPQLSETCPVIEEPRPIPETPTPEVGECRLCSIIPISIFIILILIIVLIPRKKKKKSKTKK